MTQYSGWGEREIGLFGYISHSLKSWALTHLLSFFPMREIKTKKGFLSTKLCHCGGEGNMGNGSFPSTFSNVSNVRFFALKMPWTFSRKILNFHKSFFIYESFPKSVFSRGS